MPFVAVTEEVTLPPDVVFQRLTDMESFPAFMETVRSVKVLERGEGWTITAWEAELKGALFRWTEQDHFHPEEHRITYRLVAGDLKKFEGEWRLEATAEGCRVTLTVDFDLGIPMLAALVHPIAKYVIQQNVVSMLQGLRKALNGDG